MVKAAQAFRPHVRDTEPQDHPNIRIPRVPPPGAHHRRTRLSNGSALTGPDDFDGPFEKLAGRPCPAGHIVRRNPAGYLLSQLQRCRPPLHCSLPAIYWFKKPGGAI